MEWEIMEALGINLTQFIAQVINFLIVVVLLWKFAYTPILKILEERENKISKGLADAEKAEQSLKNAEDEAKKIKEAAHKEANEILKNAKEAASTEATEIVKKANDQADRVIENAKEEANGMKQKVLAEAKKEISQVVLLALDKIVTEELDQQTKEKITQRALSEL